MKKRLLILSTLIIFTLSIMIIIFFSYDKKNVSYALKVPESLAIYIFNEETNKYDKKTSIVPHGYELNSDKSYCESGGEVINYNAYEEYVNYALATGDKCHLYFDRYLPEGYTKLEYLESTGTQYINTGVQNSTSASFDVEMDVMYTTTNVANQIMGFTGNRGQGIGPGYNYFWESELSEGSGSYNEATVSGIIYNLKWGKKANTYYRIYNGKRYAGTQGNTTAFTTNMLLFAAYQTANSTTVDYLCHAKLYYAKIKKDGALVRDLVPALNLQGEAGLYDRVEKKFYANAGTGQFKYAISGDELPPEYTQLEYLESTGTQHIDTGYKPNQNTQIVADFSYSSSGYLFGSEDTWAVGMFMFHSNLFCYADQAHSLTISSNSKHTINFNKDTVYLDGALVKLFTSRTFSTNYNLSIFGTNAGGSVVEKVVGKIYYLKILDNGKLVRNYIPALNRDGIPGMYDTVEGKFYTNAGTGQFKYSVNNNRLPSGYIPVRYIESSGTQYIDTGVSPTSNMEVEIAFTPTGGLQENAIFGSSWSASGYFLMFYNNQIRWHSGGAWVDIGSYSAGDRVQCYATNSYIIVNGTKYNIAGGSNSSNNIVLLGDMGYNSSKKGIGKIEYVKMWDNGVLVRDLVPCINPYGEVGLYDVVNNKFYGNVGTGVFKAGASSEYTTLNYLESSGTQYINTGYYAGSNTMLEVVASYTGPYSIYGGSPGTMNFTAGGSGGYFYYLSGAGQSTVTDLSNVVHTFKQDNNKAYIDGSLYYTWTEKKFTDTNTEFLFARNNNGTINDAGGTVRIYSAKFWENYKLVRYFVPCKNSAGTVGLYEALTGKFYTNAGTGTFASG